MGVYRIQTTVTITSQMSTTHLCSQMAHHHAHYRRELGCQHKHRHSAVAATDQDKKPDPVNPTQLIAKDTITYSIPTTGDAAAFSIDSNTGQLKTKNALNYENDNSYTVVVTASDGSLTDTITVTISVTNVNEAPTFATGATASVIFLRPTARQSHL